jgi:hypothetical protein
LLNLNAAARALDVCPRTLWGAAKAGQIPVVRIGRSVRFDVRDLVAYIDTNKGAAR